MNKILLLLIVLIPSLSWGKMKTLNEILQIRDMSDKTSVLYVMQRCSGLFATGWDHILDQNPSVAEGLLYNSRLLTYKASLLYEAPNLSEEEKLQEQVQASQNFQKIYTDFFRENWLHTGAYFYGTWLEVDLSICTAVVNMFGN